MNLINKYLYPTEPYMAWALNDILWHHLAATLTIFVGPHNFFLEYIDEKSAEMSGNLKA